MAGGGTSWFDLALFLIARLVSTDEAMRVARLQLIDWHHIGQQPFAALTRNRQADDAVIAKCQEWIAQHYDNRITSYNVCYTKLLRAIRSDVFSTTSASSPAK